MTTIDAVSVVSVERMAPADWDAHTVAPPGGHVLQSAAWAEHRSGQGWPARFVTFSDGARALVLTRRQPPLPGFLAYVPRGPIHGGAGHAAVAERARALADRLRGTGATLLGLDPELDADPAHRARMSSLGFAVSEEIQPSRHRLVLPLPRGVTEEELLRGVSKQTRQRIRGAEREGTRVTEDDAGQHLDAFGAILDAVAERRHFEFAADRGFVAWWRRVLAAGHARFLVAQHDEELLGGLLLYRQGGRYATAFSADRVESRRTYPGTMHLLRWTAIRQALRAGVEAMDLGGVDVVGHREQPREGDPTWGLYQHKASFGAQWVESEAARRLVFRPLVYGAGLAMGSVRRRVLAIVPGR